MNSSKQILAILVCLLLYVAPVFAQDPQPPAKVGQDVTVIIERQQVRFTSRSAVEEMRLQVFNQSGEAVFDSGPVTAPEINWPLQNTNGESLTSGLYAYMLSVKEFGTSSARARRGHFIVDRAKERDGNADKLWVTSQNDNGVGADLTLARDENSTVAGTALSGERTIERRAETSDRAANDREVATKTTPQTAINNLAASIAGQIAKFTGANNELGDSVIAEAGGNIGIGITPTSGAKLEVNGPANVKTGGSGGEVRFAPVNGETGMTIIGSNRADIRFNGSSLKLVAVAGNASPPSENGIVIETSGRVGVGTTTLSASRMTVEGQNALTLRGFEPFLTLQDSNVLGSADSHRIQSAHGDLVFLQEAPTQLGTEYIPRMILKDNGNVGIGTATPRYKLEVNGSTVVTPGGSGGGIEFGTPNGETGIAIVGSNRADIRFNGSTLKLVAGPAVGPPGSENGVAIATSGNVGIGTTNPATKLHVESLGPAELTIKSRTERAILALSNGLNPQGYVWTLESGVGGSFPSLFGIYNRNVGKPGLTIDGSLLVSVKALEITGGADFAENFDVSAEKHEGSSSGSEIQPGMVVAIDPLNPGKLNLSRRAYDRRVAGIISGAGDVKPGMMMGQAGTLADGKHPVALSGRVYCWVDATRGAIKPGDLLTTSATPGHAMKVTNSAKAQGAIIGKAMTELKSGKGLVLVLVTLQ